ILIVSLASLLLLQGCYKQLSIVNESPTDDQAVYIEIYPENDPWPDEGAPHHDNDNNIPNKKRDWERRGPSIANRPEITRPSPPSSSGSNSLTGIRPVGKHPADESGQGTGNRSTGTVEGGTAGENDGGKRDDGLRPKKHQVLDEAGNDGDIRPVRKAR
ncbi:MAG: hypothetical protein GWN62_35720, partial [Aliifodinibius sp.]|nr:hypothetical protein [Fodinibius sp.]